MLCLTCGKKNPEGAVYCGQCGTALGPVPPAAPQVAPAAAPQVAPPATQIAVTPRRQTYTLKRILIVGGILVAIFLFLLLLFGASSLALLLAVIPAVFYVSLAVWVDRYEPEPWWLAGGAFLWGASVAVLIAYILNSLGAQIVSGAFGDDLGDVYGSSISAPFVEEAAKGLVLLYVFRRRREELNGLLDGVVYASLVGLGFAMTENVLYYVNNSDNIGSIFVMRGLLTPFLHPLFTAATGVGLVLALRARTRKTRMLAPLLGFGAAVALHSIWNTSAGAGLGLMALVGFGLFVPVIVMFVILLRRSLRFEAAVIREYLPAGTVPAEDIERLTSVKTRFKDAVRSLRKGGLSGYAAREDYIAALSDLAFSRAYAARAQPAAATAPEPASVQESAKELLADLRREWRAPTTR